MLYFEDFMEAIENLPDDLNESLSTVRQLDLLTQSVVEPLLEASNSFFEECKYNRLSDQDKLSQFGIITKQYDTALSYSKEKREIVEKIYCMYKNIMRKLDTEIGKFRLELEADNSGIIEQIEKRVSSRLNKSSGTNGKPEKRRQRFRYQSTGHFKNPFLMHRRIVGQACRTVLKSSVGRPIHPAKPDTLDNRHPSSRSGVQRSLSVNDFITRRTPSNVFGIDSTRQNTSDVHFDHLDEVGFTRRNRPVEYTQDAEVLSAGDVGFEAAHGSNFFTSTSNQKSKLDEDPDSVFSNNMFMLTKNSPFFGIGANTEFTASVIERSSNITSGSRASRLGSVNSYIVTSDVADGSLSSGRITGPVDSRHSDAPSPISWHGIGTSRERRSRASRRPARDLLLDEPNSDSLHSTENLGFEENTSSAPGSTSDGMFESSTFGFVTDVKLDAAAEALDDEDQKRYCVCNDVSYGDMIACDNPGCPFEWFHYSCVNLTVAPKGDWFCPNCIKTLVATKGVKKRITRR